MRKILIDARAMAHPEPLEKGIDALKVLDTQSYLYMLNRKNPIPLLAMATGQNFQVLSQKDAKGDWHILIARTPHIDLNEYIDTHAI